MAHSGTLFLVAAPSGAGKTSLVNELVATTKNIEVSVSHTTRAMRPGETEGVNYFFVEPEQFDAMADAGEFMEAATVFGHRYGTSSAWVEKKLKAGIDVILEIDWQGARQVRETHPDSIGVFIAPPSVEALKARLHARGQDGIDVIQERMAEAKSELSHCDEFDYFIVNEDFSKALADFTVIVAACRLSYARQQARQQDLLERLR